MPRRSFQVSLLSGFWLFFFLFLFFGHDFKSLFETAAKLALNSSFFFVLLWSMEIRPEQWFYYKVFFNLAGISKGLGRPCFSSGSSSKERKTWKFPAPPFSFLILNPKVGLSCWFGFRFLLFLKRTSASTMNPSARILFLQFCVSRDLYLPRAASKRKILILPLSPKFPLETQKA